MVSVSVNFITSAQKSDTLSELKCDINNQLHVTDLSIPPENIKKPVIFRCLQGVKKRPVAWNGLEALYCSTKPGFLYELIWVNWSSFSRDNFIIYVRPNGNME